MLSSFCTIEISTIICGCSVHIYVIGGASTASEATLSSCPLRFAIYVGGYVQSIPEAVAMW